MSLNIKVSVASAGVLLLLLCINHGVKNSTRNAAKQKMNLSLWLMAPDTVSGTLTEKIQFLAETYTPSSGPFLPHVTIVGGIRSKDTQGTLDALSSALTGKYPGGIPCRFFGGLSSGKDAEGNFVWSQALAAVMERSPEYMNLVEASRLALKMPAEHRFPPPLSNPHMSLYYGVQNVPGVESIEIPSVFLATEAALWVTYPATVDGVKSWKEIGRVSLTNI